MGGRATKAVALLLPVAILAGVGTTVGFRNPFGSSPAGHHRGHARATARKRPLAKAGTVSQTPLVGVFEPGLPGPWAKVTAFAKATGVTPRLVLTYSGWRVPFRYGFAKTAEAHGTELLVQMQPWKTPMSAIAAGEYDGYLRSYAQSVRQFGGPVVIGFAHEMNGTWYPWGYTHESAASFVAAWRHIVTVFRSQGATNVTWLWTIGGAGTGPPKSYWPGRKYVTWVGVDGYYMKPTWRFSKVSGTVINEVRTFTQAPILLAEDGIGQMAGQAKTLPNLFAGMKRDHLLGLVWFDVHQCCGVRHQDWALHGDKALAAFKQGILALREDNAAKPPRRG